MGAVLLCAAPLPAAASDSARRAADYLVGHQAPDGTFFGDDAPHRTAETLVALVAGGVTGAPVWRALAAVTSRGPAAATKAGEAGLLALGVVAAGGDPREYVARIRSFYDERLGHFDTQQFQNALALLGIVAAGEKLPEQAVTYLRLNRCADGGIPIVAPCRGIGGHVDVTALVLQALVADGLSASDSLRADARSFLASARNGEGGFGDAKGAATNANSTGLVLAAVAAMGEPASAAPWREAMPLLLSLQQADGRFWQNRTSEGDSYVATRQAVLGVASRPHPVQPNPAPRSSPTTEVRSATVTTTAATTTVRPTLGRAAPSSPALPPSTATATPSTPAVFRRYGTPGSAIPPENAAVVGGERERRRQPVGPAAIAAALLVAVAWRGARLPRPRGDHAIAARSRGGNAPVPDG